jgi:alkylation response protein AidB-like acyl-CoA dehydrogenase
MDWKAAKALSRAFRDYKVMEIGDGTTEIQKLIIACESGC